MLVKSLKGSAVLPVVAFLAASGLALPFVSIASAEEARAPLPGGLVFERPAAPALPEGADAPTARAGMPVGRLATGRPEVASIKIDDSALRYYVRQNNLPRVEAEIRRLQALYPEWRPPQDLSTLFEVDNAEQPIWDLFAADRLEEARAAIAARKKAEPGWQPSADLAAKLATKEDRRRLMNAADAAQWQTVVEIAGQNPALVSGDDVEVRWRIAEAHARAGQPAEAARLYRAVIAESTDKGIRRATVQKAIGTLPDAEIDALIAAAGGDADFADLALDRVRARIGKAIADKTPARAEDVSKLEAAALSSSGPGDAALLGWYRHSQSDWTGAIAAFDRALERGGEAKAAEGAILARRAAGRTDEADRLAAAWADRSPDIATLALAFFAEDVNGEKAGSIPAGRLARIAPLVEARKDAAGAEALGWIAYNGKDAATAQGWFEKSFAWSPSEARALGVGLSLARLGERTAFADWQKQHGAAYPKLAALTLPKAGTSRRTGSDPVAAAHKAGDFARCLSLLDKRARKGRLSAQDSLMRGWCLLDAKRPREAAVAFEAARSSRGRIAGDADYGLSIANLRAGGTRAAATVVATLDPARQATLGIAVLTQRAAKAFDTGAYRQTIALLDERRAQTPETRDLMLLRGWAFYHLRRYHDARAIFAAVDRSLSSADSRRALAMANRKLMAPARY